MAIVQNTPSQLITLAAVDASATPITTDVLIGVTIRWLAPTTIGNSLVIKDGVNSITQVVATCSVAASDYPAITVPVLNGLTVPTMTTGTLEIHYQDRKQLVAPQGTPVITRNNPIS